MTLSWRLLTPRHLPGPVAIIELSASNPAALEMGLGQLGVGEVEVESAPLRTIAGIDQGLVARWSASTCHLMIHGGPAIVRELTRFLLRLGISEATEACFPEAENQLEARLLHELSGACSPLAVDLLLDQPRRWRDSPDHSDAPTLRDRVLRRLVVPPLVIALEPPNVGKSSLLNALADRPVAAVADEPGTTRDHVGAFIDLAGLVVRYLDTPGLRSAPDPIEAHATELLRPLLHRADLVLLCGDSTASPDPAWVPQHVPRLSVATRSDLGPSPFSADIAVSIRHPDTLASLVRRLRNVLIPPAMLQDPAPWVFWDTPQNAPHP